VVTLFQSLYTLSFITSDRVSNRLQTLKDDERGASAVEYALLVGLIAAAVVAAVALFRTKLVDLFTNIDTHDPSAPAG
jgi:pilus assembly protein Flp/PilA